MFLVQCQVLEYLLLYKLHRGAWPSKPASLLSNILRFYLEVTGGPAVYRSETREGAGREVRPADRRGHERGKTQVGTRYSHTVRRLR